MAADWSSIPPELVCLTANKLSAIEDYSSLTAVCRSFRSATEGAVWRPEEVSQPPWLLLPSQDGDSSREDPPTSERGLISMYRGDGEKLFMNLPELQGRRCWGSPYGWIITLGLDRKLHLFNPLNRRRIALPDPISGDEVEDDDDVRMDFIERVILIKRPPGSLPSSVDFLVLTTSRAGGCRVLRHGCWIDVEFFPFRNLPICDLICYKGQIYALSNRGRLWICSNLDNGPDPPKANEFVPLDFPAFKHCEKYYIVESLGELLLVLRNIGREDDDSHGTVDFQVFRLDFETKKWVEIQDLGGCALFVGDCQSMSLSQPEDYNFRRNCIYSTDDFYLHNGKLGRDMGIYDFEDPDFGMERLLDDDESLSRYCTSIWFIPTHTV